MKQFEVSDNLSGNKIGVDGTLIGSWTPIDHLLYRNVQEADGVNRGDHIPRILDVGCGCGIISLMMAQRVPDAKIIGIDIERNAVAEATSNCACSPFASRISIQNIDFSLLKVELGQFDLIVSNPPFFESGGDPATSERMLARHIGSLSPEILLRKSSMLLKTHGLLSFIAPYDLEEKYISIGKECGLSLLKSCVVQGNPNARPKRTMMVFGLAAGDGSGRSSQSHPTRDYLIIESAPGIFSEEYIRLGKEFYLKM